MASIPTGIDLGTSNSVIAVYKDGKVNIVPNLIGDPITPSVVVILDKGEAIGEEIMLHKINEKNTIIEIKRIIGKKYSELKDLRNLSYNIVPSKDDKIQIKIIRNGKEEFFSPEEIMSLIFKKLIKNASNFVETKIKKAVVTVPAYFDYCQRSAIVESARLAGIEVLRIINEPTAAALAYGLGTQKNLNDSIALSIIKKDNIKNRKIIVFDLGGGTFDVTILILENNNYNVKASFGDTHLGGIDFDNKLIDFCLNDFCQKMGIKESDVRKDLNALRRLRVQCEKGKKRLTNNNSTNIKIYNFYKNNDLFIEISRDRFNEECKKLYNRIEEILDQVLKESKFTIEEINDVILIGGSSRIPKIKEMLGKKFGQNKIRDTINQDEAVAIGATWQAYKLIKPSENNENIILDITPFSLGVGNANHIEEERKHGLVMSFLIEKNTKIPTKSNTIQYKTIIDNQTHFTIQVFSGEDKYCNNNKLLKIFEIDNLPKGKKGNVLLAINFEIDANGILIINAEVESIGKKVTEKYSLYENNNLDKNTNIKHNIKGKEKEQLNEIKQIKEFITERNDLLKSTKNIKEKNEILNNLSESCSKLIEIYESLKKDNDSEIIYDKIFNYTKLLFNYYYQIIILNEDEKITADIIQKIKEIMPKFINDNIENLIDIFVDLKPVKPKNYFEIVLFCVEILYQEGDKILNERKKYARYNSKKIYLKAEKIKKYLGEDIIKKIDLRLNNKYNEIKKKYDSKLEEINSFVNIIKNQIEEKDTPFLPKQTGFSLIKKIVDEQIIDEENLFLILDIYQEMADSLGEGVSEAKAFCLANIIKIKFSFFKSDNFELYDKLNEDIEYIYERLIEEEDKPEPEWHKKLSDLNKEIETKRSLINNPENTNKNNIDEINNNFNDNIKENKPIDFIHFILEKYPFFNYDSSQKEMLKNKDFQELFYTIFPKYHPDNYEKKEIYSEIYSLLVNMEIKYKLKRKNT